MKPRVYGIGNPLIDIFIHVQDEDLGSLGVHKGTMHLIDEERRLELLEFAGQKEKVFSCGGSAPNTMVALSAFGIVTALAGKVGKDEYGDRYEEKLKTLAVIPELKRGTGPTGTSIIMITPDRERTMNTYLGANREFGPGDVNPELIRQADYFYFTGYMWDTESQKAAILKAIDIAEGAGTKVVFDVADPFAVSRNRDEFLQLIRGHASIAFANSEESRILFDHYDASFCARSMGELCSVGVVKNGKKGSFVSSGGDLISIPVVGKEPVDTTGAGDMYAAGFILGLCMGFGLYDTGLLASFLAGEIVGQRGAQFSPEKAEELYALIKSGRWKNL